MRLLPVSERIATGARVCVGAVVRQGMCIVAFTFHIYIRVEAKREGCG